MLKRMNLRSEESVRAFCAMLNLPFEDVWAPIQERCGEGTMAMSAEEHAAELREEVQIDKVMHPYKPSHLEFEHRINFTGTVMALRIGLDTVVPQDAQVPDDAAALRPAVVHGRALAMRACAIRTCMQKHPTQHKPKPKAKIVTAEAAVARQQAKQRVHSLAQYQHCRSMGCKRGGECVDPAHILPARRKEEARTAALAATSAAQIPCDDVLGLLTRQQLDGMCKQIGLSRTGNKDAVKARLAEARACAASSKV